MAEPIRQGDLYYCQFPAPIQSRPVLVLSRGEINAVRENIVVSLVTRTIRHIPLEIPVGKGEGLPKGGVANLGDIHTVPKSLLSHRKGSLPKPKMEALRSGLRLLFSIP